MNSDVLFAVMCYLGALMGMWERKTCILDVEISR